MILVEIPERGTFTVGRFGLSAWRILRVEQEEDFLRYMLPEIPALERVFESREEALAVLNNYARLIREEVSNGSSGVRL